MENLSEKELRNKRIIDLHNEGKTIQQIVDVVGMSKGGVHKVLQSVLLSGEIAPKEPIKNIEIKGDEERFDNFTGWTRTNVNEYVNEKSGEVVRIAFVKAKSKDEFGYFVKVN
jgi:hypothetical protein